MMLFLLFIGIILGPLWACMMLLEEASRANWTWVGASSCPWRWTWWKRKRIGGTIGR